MLVTVNGGVVPFSLTVIRNPGRRPTRRSSQIPPRPETDKRQLSPRPSWAWRSTRRAASSTRPAVTAAVVAVFSLATGARVAAIDLSTHRHPGAFTTDLALSADGRHLYALDLAHFRLVAIDTARREAVGSVTVGRNPLALALERRRPAGLRGQHGHVPVFARGEARRTGSPRACPSRPSAIPREKRERAPRWTAAGCPAWATRTWTRRTRCSWSTWSGRKRPRVVARLKTGMPIGAVPSAGAARPAWPCRRTPSTSRTPRTTPSRPGTSSTHRRRWSTLLWLRHRTSPGLRGVLPFGIALSPTAAGSSSPSPGSTRWACSTRRRARCSATSPRAGTRRGSPCRRTAAALRLECQGLRAPAPTAAPASGRGPGRARQAPEADLHYIGRLMRGSVSLIDIPPDDSLAADDPARPGQQRVPARGRRPGRRAIPCLRAPGAASTADQTRGLHHQGEPHVRRGLRRPAGRQGRPEPRALRRGPDGRPAPAA